MEVLLEDQIRERLVRSERAKARAEAEHTSMASAAGSKLLSFVTSKAEKI